MHLKEEKRETKQIGKGENSHLEIAKREIAKIAKGNYTKLLADITAFSHDIENIKSKK